MREEVEEVEEGGGGWGSLVYRIHSWCGTRSGFSEDDLHHSIGVEPCGRRRPLRFFCQSLVEGGVECEECNNLILPMWLSIEGKRSSSLIVTLRDAGPDSESV